MGKVFLVAVLPALLVKVSAPYWFPRVPYAARALAAAGLMVAAFLMVALASTPSAQLGGIALASAQAGLGEASTLALGGAYDSHRTLLTAWSSGTGFSGIFGYSWVILFHTLGGKSLRVTLLSALSFPAVWIISQFLILTPPPTRAAAATAAGERAVIVSASGGRDAEAGDVALTTLARARTRSGSGEGTTKPAAPADGIGAEASGLLVARSSADSHGGSVPATPTGEQPPTPLSPTTPVNQMPVGLRATARHVASLWRYTVPLVVVYFAEYVCQAGVWAAVGFPSPSNARDRDRFYKAANWCYQAGVFVSRSSGSVLQVSLPWLCAMPTLQAGLLAFFATIAAIGPASPLYGWWLLAPAVVVGLMGGGTYVNAFTLLAATSPPATRELSLGAASVADSVGIAAAAATAMMVQGCLFARHGVAGAAFKCGARS